MIAIANDPPWGGWEQCTTDECQGSQLATGQHCWAHADQQELQAALEQFGGDGELDARGVHLTAGLLQHIIKHAPRDPNGKPMLTVGRFDRATFTGLATFNGMVFEREAVFTEATFKHGAVFAGTTFAGPAEFTEATFQGTIDLPGHPYVNEGRPFTDTVIFTGATFKRTARFDRAAFDGEGAAKFEGVIFHWAASFRGATFTQHASFARSNFEQALSLGPFQVEKILDLQEATFNQRIKIQVAAAVLCAQRTRFLAGAHLQVRWAQVLLDDADLAAPSILDTTPGFSDVDETRLAQALGTVPTASPPEPGTPRLLSIRRADVAGLTVTGVDLHACRFATARNLDQLSIDCPEFLPSAPQGWRWTARRTIADEHHWRHDRGTPGWYPASCRPPGWVAQPEPPAPHAAEVASAYQALRKGREARGDEPGAADFAYGEMELRRHDPTRPAVERRVLFGYWLAAGYALRASRALLLLLGLLLLATVLLAGIGLQPPPTTTRVGVNSTQLDLSQQAPDPCVPASAWSVRDRLVTAGLVAVEGAVFRSAEQQLTSLGRLIQAVLRFGGPVLLGLALLSIRSRVKR